MNPIADLLLFLPLGLLILWIKNKGRKSFRSLLKEHETYELKVEAVSLLLNIVAGIGVLFMLFVVLFMIGSLIWKGIKAIFW